MLAGRIRLRLAAAAGALAAALAPPLAHPPPSAAQECAVSATLVNSCRPWLGAVAGGYPGLPTWKDQILAHERRIGRPVDVAHQYHPVGYDTLSSDELYLIDRGTILYVNWKPAEYWRDAAGGNATVDARIDTLARSIKAVAPHRVMLAVWGEPERFTSVGTSTCPELRGNRGSPADYRAMWRNVRTRFDAAGVTNVVWVVNYLGYVRWDCLFPELWPGNDLVDWIVWDPYVGPNERWDALAGHFYDQLLTKSDAAHNYLSKAWGLAEFGYWYGTNQAEAYRMYDDAKASLDAGRYPRLKLYEPFDTIAADGTDIRISYTAKGVFDQTEQDHYNALANDPAFSTGTPPPPPGTSTDYFAACDTSVETGLSCYAGTYATPVYPTWYAGDGYAGTHSVQVLNTTASAGTYGLNAKPVPVASTVAGRTYAGAVWVKGSQAGLKLTLLLRERRADGTAPPGGYTATTLTAPDTGWHRVAATYTAQAAGDGLTYSVYASGLPAGAWLRADVFSLTSTP